MLKLKHSQYKQLTLFMYYYEEQSWPWSYGSWIYNCLCNLCLLPLMLWVRILLRALNTIKQTCWGWGVQHYVIKFVSDLRQVSGFLQVLRFPPPIKLTTTI